MHHRHEMLDLVIVDGKARGIIARNLVTGEIERHSAHAVVIASGGYGNVFSCQLMQWEVTLRQLENTQERSFCKSLLHKFTQHVFLFQEIINPN
jgi:succinate dehydrogenase / fumarate reductase flavoprotein subunit